ncbi:S1C family serine protease [uncultured Azohydromonas sp.]|mgnify:CR=1 FL=1|jgi:Trypsin-like serine proteases, typically periplasmic, contain C-terminal PDZ domain|uniref:S1C family serine protease n=1 Tax=uncultured Azohydromonas sp. TaxID=487342 RepID=UPI002607E16C|nr:S1C family serine protease [uncultured Azohydromonas sp.]
MTSLLSPRPRSRLRHLLSAPRLRWCLTMLAALASAGVWTLAQAQEEGPPPDAAAQPPAASATEGGMSEQERMLALRRASDAVLGVEVLALPNARSNDSVGRERQGSGVVIDHDGLVLTIGYLIVEADQVQLVLDDQRRLPARVVAYDVATGFGLVQALTPLPLSPAPMGDSTALRDGEPIMIVSGGDSGAVSLAQVISRRPFSGYWEYQIDQAVFTIPPRADHSGAALFNAEGELLGVGSLLVANALDGDGATRMPGNMFVPVELLKPILAELRSQGSSTASRRAWLGLNCMESDGQVQVLRVNSESPAEVAGLQPGDRIERIDGASVQSLEQLWKQLWSGGQAEREVTLDVRRDGQPRRFTVHSVDRMTTLSKAEGI